jgi:hypothetical protein
VGRIWLGLGAVALLVAGCVSTSAPFGPPSQSIPSASSPSATSQPSESAVPGVASLATAPPRGHAGAYLPARSVTPGAVNRAVTQATIGTTICKAGFTAKVRPPQSYTDQLKLEQLTRGYAVGGNSNPEAYEEDHVIPLELGGSPSSVKNLWPEPWERSGAHPEGFASVGTGAQTKDRVEDSLRTRVCDHRITLAAAQRMIAVNWRAAFDTYIGSHTSTRTTGTPKATQQPAVSLPVVHPGAFCSPPGARGVTSAGTPMVCKLDSKGIRYRWGHA